MEKSKKKFEQIDFKKKLPQEDKKEEIPKNLIEFSNQNGNNTKNNVMIDWNEFESAPVVNNNNGKPKAFGFVNGSNNNNQNSQSQNQQQTTQSTLIDLNYNQKDERFKDIYSIYDNNNNQNSTKTQGDFSGLKGNPSQNPQQQIFQQQNPYYGIFMIN